MPEGEEMFKYHGYSCPCPKPPLPRPETEQDRMRKDAARYNWLRENRPILLLTGFFGNGCINRTIDEIDAEIDSKLTTPNAQESKD